MTGTLDYSFRGMWFPVVRCEQIGLRQIHRSQLLNQELAIWRDDDGQINAWENRCPHRGASLADGNISESIIQCKFHLWEFDLETGCAIANSDLRVKTFPVKVKNDEVFIID